jgi:hypothetical protein
MMNMMIARLLLAASFPAAALGASPDSGWVRVVADPDGSPVYIGGRYVGTSPVDSVRWVAGQAVVHAQMGPRSRWSVHAAVETVDVPPARLVEVRLTVPPPLRVIGQPEPVESPTVMHGPGTLGVRSETWTVASGAAMVASGVLAAVFRDKANRAASRYLDTRDPVALQDVRRYDRYAGAAMVGVQLSLGAFVLFLAGP